MTRPRGFQQLLTEQAVEDKTLTVVGKGVGIWDHIHVRSRYPHAPWNRGRPHSYKISAGQISNLVLAYEKILEHLTTTPPPHPLYFFAETGHHSWLSFAQAIQQVLVKKGLVSDEITFDPIPSCKLLYLYLVSLLWEGGFTDSLSCFSSPGHERAVLGGRPSRARVAAQGDGLVLGQCRAGG